MQIVNIVSNRAYARVKAKGGNERGWIRRGMNLGPLPFVSEVESRLVNACFHYLCSFLVLSC